ncbi:MAG: nucleotidyltransferase family protein [Anaerolineales bacterium]|nr:nucleotidyltransferase family protein [Anaerolineales bacterium]
MTNPGTVSAIVVAAGLSSRMGQNKLLLPFDGRTVIEHIVSVLLESPVDEVLVVTGHQHEALAQRLAAWPVRLVFNPDYAQGEMLSSVQAGLRAAAGAAALLALGDLPTLERGVIARIVAAYRLGLGSLVFPSYQMRRGHPLLVDRSHWTAILALGGEQNLRGYFRSVPAGIHHVAVDSPAVLHDMDTPEQYQRVLAEQARRRATGVAV